MALLVRFERTFYDNLEIRFEATGGNGLPIQVFNFHQYLAKKLVAA
jgi:hypothetical protein